MHVVHRLDARCVDQGLLDLVDLEPRGRALEEHAADVTEQHHRRHGDQPRDEEGRGRVDPRRVGDHDREAGGERTE